MKKITKTIFFILFCFTLCISVSHQADAKKNFTISSSSKPYKNKYVKTPSYNKYTKHYLTIRSYLDYMATNGGGTG